MGLLRGTQRTPGFQTWSSVPPLCSSSPISPGQSESPIPAGRLTPFLAVGPSTSGPHDGHVAVSASSLVEALVCPSMEALSMMGVQDLQASQSPSGRTTRFLDPCVLPILVSDSKCTVHPGR